jgi:hypothetical protein
MNIHAPMFLCVMAVLCRTQTVFNGDRGARALSGLGNLILLYIPLSVMLLGGGFRAHWLNVIYIALFSLGVVLMALSRSWEERWPLALVWTIFPLVMSPSPQGLWLCLIVVEFLLFFAYQGEDTRSDYHKYALVRLLIVFQFFVFDGLLLQQRPLWVAKTLAILLCGNYLLSCLRLLVRAHRSHRFPATFMAANLFYGILLFERLWGRLPTFS